MLVRNIFRILLLSFMSLMFVPVAYTWGPVAHYHVNRQAEPDREHAEIYAVNGTGPDMSVLIGFPFVEPPPVGASWDWADFFHSPDPKKNKNGVTIVPYWNSPNFAYLMLKVPGLDTGVSPKDEAYALGWGGHIAADWVAHNDNLFPISPRWSEGETLHLLAETLHDIYTYDTRGPMSTFDYEFPFRWKTKFHPSLVYKALVNYQLISIYETKASIGESISDQNLKEKARATTLPKDYIQELSTWFARSNAIIQAGYKIMLKKMNPAGRAAFRQEMRAKGAEENLALAAQAVSDWIEAKTPRNGIPDFDDKVIPFWSTSSSSPSAASAEPLTADLDGIINPLAIFQSEPAQAETVHTTQESRAHEPDAHEAAYVFWEDIAAQAEQQGILETEEQTIVDEDGEQELEVTVTLTDPGQFEDIVTSTIQSHTQNPPSEIGQRYAYLWKNLLIDGIYNPDQLADSTPPAISDPIPQNGSFTPWHKPTISAIIQDDYLGIGLDEQSIRMTVDGRVVDPLYVPALHSVIYQPPDYLGTGKHTVNLTVLDKAGNKSSLSWSFAVKNRFEHLLFAKTVMLSGSPTVSGSIYSSQDLTVSGNTRVYGDIITAGQMVVKGKSCLIEGQVKEAEPILPFPPIDFSYYEALAKKQGARLTGDVHLTEQNELPALVFVDGNVKITGDRSATPTPATIFATGAIELSADLDLRPAIDNMSLVAREGIMLSGEGSIKGVVYAKDGDITVSGNKSYFGVIHAVGSLRTSGTSRIGFDPSLRE